MFRRVDERALGPAKVYERSLEAALDVGDLAEVKIVDPVCRCGPFGVVVLENAVLKNRDPAFLAGLVTDKHLVLCHVNRSVLRRARSDCWQGSPQHPRRAARCRSVPCCIVLDSKRVYSPLASFVMQALAWVLRRLIPGVTHTFDRV